MHLLQKAAAGPIRAFNIALLFFQRFYLFARRMRTSRTKQDQLVGETLTDSSPILMSKVIVPAVITLFLRVNMPSRRILFHCKNRKVTKEHYTRSYS